MSKRKRKKEDGGSRTKLKGVYQRGERFYAKIKIDGSEQCLGTFDIPKEAARAYDRAAIQAGRPTSQMNFQDKIPKNYKPKRKKLGSRNTSGYRGVYKDGNRFIARITVDRKKKNLGCFGTAKEGAIAWDLAAIQAKRPISELNFPDINILDTKTKTKKKKTISIKKRKTTKTTLSTTTKSNKSNNSNNSSSCSLDTLATLVSAVPRRRMTNL